MRSTRRQVGYGLVKSRSHTDILLTVEECEKLIECDPDKIESLEKFLTHLGLIQKVNHGEEEAAAE